MRTVKFNPYISLGDGYRIPEVEFDSRNPNLLTLTVIDATGNVLCDENNHPQQKTLILNALTGDVYFPAVGVRYKNSLFDEVTRCIKNNLTTIRETVQRAQSANNPLPPQQPMSMQQSSMQQPANFSAPPAQQNNAQQFSQQQSALQTGFVPMPMPTMAPPPPTNTPQQSNNNPSQPQFIFHFPVGQFLQIHNNYWVKIISLEPNGSGLVGFAKYF